MDRLPDHAATQALEQAERQARIELAACYRLFDHLGWTEMIFNHITVRVPSAQTVSAGPDQVAGCHYLINAFGLHYSEITADNLLKIDATGSAIGGDSSRVNRAGIVIHSAIHSSRPDAHCVMHTHTTAGCAVACKQSGLRSDNFYSAMLHGAEAYHDFEGVATSDDEQPRLLASLGQSNYLILRNHGLLTVGETVAQAFHRLWTLQRACEIQLASDAGQGPNHTVAGEVLRANPGKRLGTGTGANDVPQMMFDAMLRKAGIQRENLAAH